MNIAVGAKTDVGLKRPHNEDYLCVDPEVGLYAQVVLVVGALQTDIGLGPDSDVHVTSSRSTRNCDYLCVDPEVGLFVVCDGLGGRNAGEVASRLAVEVIQKHVREAQRNANLPMVGAYDRQFSPSTNRLASAIRLANQAICDAATNQPDQDGMGTTGASAILNGQTLSVAHVGDSRLYLIRGDTIEPLTEDHSLVAEQVRRGMLTEEEAERSPQKNIITRALGIDAAVDVHLHQAP